MADVSIVMGSDSDLETMGKAADLLDTFGITYEMTILSAHREPDLFFRYASSAEERGVKVIIAGAGMAAHLPGMGTFSPSPFYTDEIAAQCESEIFRPTVAAMEREGRIFQGVLFFGLMLTEAGPRLLEYNARFGDPETQVVLPRMENDIVEVMEACVDGTLDGVDLKFADNAALCVILASGGYPVKYETGKEISGLGSFAGSDGCFCFQAGTKRDGGKIVTNGGRVLGVTAVAPSLSLARRKAYDAAKRVSFDGMYCRSDIGKDFAEP